MLLDRVWFWLDRSNSFVSVVPIELIEYGSLTPKKVYKIARGIHLSVCLSAAFVSVFSVLNFLGTK